MSRCGKGESREGGLFFTAEAQRSPRDAELELIKWKEKWAKRQVLNFTLHPSLLLRILVHHVDGGAAYHGDVSKKVVLADDELVEFHQFQNGEESDDDFRLSRCGFEKGIETERFAGFKMIEEKFDLIGDRKAIIHDVAEVMGFFKAFENVLKRSDEIEDGNFRESSRFFFRFVCGIGLEGETALLIELAEREEAGGVFEFFVFDELTDEFPAWIIFFNVLFRGLLGAWQQGSGFKIHQIGCHDDELGGEIDVQELERVDVIEVLFGDFLDRNRLDIQLVLFDKVEQEIQRTFKDF